MRHYWIVLVSAVLLLALPAIGKDQPKFKTIEIKHFPYAEGVELGPEFPDFLYAELKTELQKAKLSEQIVGEGEVVDAADAPLSIIIEGTVLEYKKGNLVKEAFTPFHLGGHRSMRAQLKVTRRSNNETVLDKELKVDVSSTADPKHLARFMAKQIARELKQAKN
jgi:hypothetical protein